MSRDYAEYTVDDLPPKQKHAWLTVSSYMSSMKCNSVQEACRAMGVSRLNYDLAKKKLGLHDAEVFYCSNDDLIRPGNPILSFVSRVSTVA